MQIHLSEEIEQFIREQTASGRYDDASHVIEAAVRQMRDRGRKMADLQRAMLEAELDPVVVRG
jgi:putative addiction module CopG family antidote